MVHERPSYDGDRPRTVDGDDDSILIDAHSGKREFVFAVSMT